MSGTILLADDSLTIQKVVELTFADTDYRVVAVSSGDELLDRLHDASPDVIICDVIMPGRDGYDVCQQIKSSPDWLHLPVILLTGTFEPFDRDRAIAAGCSEIITKPFEARKLVDTVERLVGSADKPAAAAVSPPFEDPAGGADFGTRMADHGSDDDGIEFTTSGFAEMEAAGTAGSGGAVVDREDGIEYDLGPPPGDFERTTPSTAPPPASDMSAQTVKIDLSSFRTPQAESDAEPVPPEAEPEAAAVDAAGTPESTPGPFGELDAEPFEAVLETWPEDDEAGDDERSMADTSPIDAPDDSSTGPVAVAAEDDRRALTDDDVDRIARRVIELASDRLEQIAWEVVPDLA
ncbi:MAG TPA: response regulator, partial [Candidatus Sulfomarinibacteraceae bacterium]|nr:response regulator [Candidatus Sulfomarinibacteraceae bacterium]